MSSDKTSTLPTESQQSASKIPAGLETLYSLEKDHVKSSISVLILAVHWSIVRAGLRIPTSNSNNGSSSSASSSNDKKFTERLPNGWTEGETGQFTYDYADPNSPNVRYQVKVIEIVRDTTAVVTVTRLPSADSSSGSSSASASTNASKTAASTFELSNFIHFDSERTLQEQVSAESVFYNADELEKQIWSELMEPLGLKVIGLPPFQGPYDDKVKQENKETEQQTQRSQPVIFHDDPLRDDRFIPRPMPELGGHGNRPPVGPPGGFNPLFVPPGGGGGLGRSDLDPLGRFGSGMIADPRGFRTPRVGPPGRLPPGAVPPGARFDPFGPPNPNNPGQMPNWAVPNPDHDPPPPGFDDMFM